MSFFKRFLIPAANFTEENTGSSGTALNTASQDRLQDEQTENNTEDIVLPDEKSKCISESKEEENTQVACKAEENEGGVERADFPVFVQGSHTEEAVSKDGINEPVTIKSYFQDKGIDIEFVSGNLPAAPVEALAFDIAASYPQTRVFIRFIRENITRKKFEFVYVLTSHTSHERSSIISLAEKLNENGLIANLFYSKINNTLRGTISTAPRCTNFINGDFLEIYARNAAREVIEKAAEKYGCSYEFYHNVLIHKDAEDHELDIVFRVGDQIFWGEIKSGKFNPDEYRKLGIFMDFVPDKLILLAADKSHEAAESITFFYEYYCSNISMFKATLNNMIEKAIGGKK